MAYLFRVIYRVLLCRQGVVQLTTPSVTLYCGAATATLLVVKYKEWMDANDGCYLDTVSRMYAENDGSIVVSFCRMCELLTFVQHTGLRQ